MEQTPSTLTETFNKLLPIALRCGVDIIGFWDLTIGEIHAIVKNYQQREEERTKEVLANNYNIADLISGFVVARMSNKPIPPIHDVFPSMFPPPVVESREDKALLLYKEQMLDFAAAHNKKRKLVKEGENN